MDENIDNQSLKALVDYVSEQHLDEISKNKIRSFCSVQDPLTTTVYRPAANPVNAPLDWKAPPFKLY